MRKIDLAYAAGLVDGEGCIFIGKNTHKGRTGYYFWLQVNVVTTDSILAPWLACNFGGSSYIKQCHSRNYYAYHWGIYRTDALLFLKSILSYLKLKKEQAEIGIAFQEFRNNQENHRRQKKGECRPTEICEKEMEWYLELRKAKNNHRKKVEGKLFS